MQEKFIGFLPLIYTFVAILCILALFKHNIINPLVRKIKGDSNLPVEKRRRRARKKRR